MVKKQLICCWFFYANSTVFTTESNSIINATHQVINHFFPSTFFPTHQVINHFFSSSSFPKKKKELHIELQSRILCLNIVYRQQHVLRYANHKFKKLKTVSDEELRSESHSLCAAKYMWQQQLYKCTLEAISIQCGFKSQKHRNNGSYSHMNLLHFLFF